MLGILIILGILLTATVAILWWRSSSIQRRRRPVRASASLQSMDTVLADGVVKVSGRVKAKGALLEAPLSRRRCVFYEVFVEEAGGSQPIRESDATSFAVVSDTAFAQFRVEFLKVLVASETCFVSGLWNNAAPRLEK